MTDAALVARYPFLPGASELLAELKPSLEELVADPTYETVRHLAREEVLSALSPNRGEGAPGSAAFDAARPEERVLSFLYSRMVVSVAPSSQRVTRRWSDGVARRAGAQLARAGAPDEELLGLASALDLEATPSSRGPGRLSLALPSYVRLAAPLREERFRLARQELSHGEVDVGRPLAVELLEQGVRSYLLDEMAELRLEPELQTGLKTRESELLERLAALAPAFVPGGYGAVRPELFPPCMREMRGLLDHGQNVAHAGRFALASFMNKVGADVDAIVDAYRGAPNFKEGITRYQVTQIARHDGGAGYTTPDCATLAANGLCFRQKDTASPSLCYDPAKLRNPLNYYRIRTRSAARAGGASPEAPTATAPTAGSPSASAPGPSTSPAPASTPSAGSPPRTAEGPGPSA